MVRLENKYAKYGYVFELIKREGSVAIFSQKDEDSGKIYAYEVFEIKVYPESEIYGKKYPARESPPATGQWGNNAFTVHTLEQAEERMRLILDNIANRALNSITG